jgi:alkylated DNA repair dioxygenase AlkB
MSSSPRPRTKTASGGSLREKLDARARREQYDAFWQAQQKEASRAGVSPSNPHAATLPSLISLSAANVDVFPCGVIRVRNAIPPEARQRLWDAVMCAGFDYREVESESKSNQGANMWYTKAAGAPDILLHFNYYEPPTAEQPPPMSILCAADAVFKAVSKLDMAQGSLEPQKEEGEGEEGVDESDGNGKEERGQQQQQHKHPAGIQQATGSSRVNGHEKSHMTAGRVDGSPRRRATEKEKWVDEAAADAATLAMNVAKRAEEEQQALLWPRDADFRSVLAIGYKPTDTFRWHTDLAGEEGWACSISVGASATFEYLPIAAPSAVRRARAIADGSEVVRVEVGSGDCLLFHGGLLAHRLASVEPATCDDASCGMDATQMLPYVRMNLQVRVYGSEEESGLRELLARGYEYVE